MKGTIERFLYWIPRSLTILLIFLSVCSLSTSCHPTIPEEVPLKNHPPTEQSVIDSAERMKTLIPKPVSMTPAVGTFKFTNETKIYLHQSTQELTFIGQYLADKLEPSTGCALQVLPDTGADVAGNLYLTMTDADPALGNEGYVLTITPDRVTLNASQPAGLFWGVQTIRQLLPPAVESTSIQSGPWEIAAGTIRDYPRFPWRGVMLDVSRHFFGVEDVKRYIDLLTYYKMNRFHIHISDDQGWRLMINSWPNLAEFGGSTEVGGGPGGYYTQAQYADIVAYAQRRYIIIVPEIDMPGHTNAALASYPELNCNGLAPNLYTGTEVGFSSLCVNKEITFTFLEDVIREIAALTPGSYIHIGGDEAAATSPDDYKTLIERVQLIVRANGKQAVGWEEIAQVNLLPDSIAQYWSSGHARKAAEQGNKVIMSPAPKIYLDMKYNQSTPLGLTWAGVVEVSNSYNWDPATQLPGVSESDILGVEAPLWSETLQTIQDIEFMAFPRLPGVAEIGWSPAGNRGWDEYKIRLGAHGPRLTAMEVNFYRSPQVPWK
jgi:hexosaminidase